MNNARHGNDSSNIHLVNLTWAKRKLMNPATGSLLIHWLRPVAA